MEDNYKKLMVEQPNPKPKGCFHIILSFLCPCLFHYNINNKSCHILCCCLCCFKFNKESSNDSELMTDHLKQIPRINESNDDDSDFVSMANSSFATVND
ncbi:hypothetical protein SteCoe_37215 [Stentor coeruleus]|uniref:Uncharacterized protein n=1 Tax=Stentor coeruleus TaxID=5963 RepID=A0A1R2ANQ8_9CILI|nr:hypothetical protein SteCoe_37215 [Stentor coeruleus]